MDKIRRYKRELLLASAVLAPAAAGLFWLYWLGKIPKSEPAPETRNKLPVIYTVFTDPRDGQDYRTVVIGGQTWMAENLDYQTDNSWCYNDSDSYCEKYGRLYDWETAKTVCPEGWHLPSREEWNNLCQTVVGKKEADGFGETYWKGAGKKLKAKSGWNNDRGENGNGTDDYGFSALPGGYYHDYGMFIDAGFGGKWWTTAEYDTANAHNMTMGNWNGDVGESWNSKSYGFSVRCVQPASDTLQERTTPEPVPETTDTPTDKSAYDTVAEIPGAGWSKKNRWADDWNGVACREYATDDGYTDNTDCIFPNAKLKQVFDIVKKIHVNIRTELPVTNLEDTCIQEGCIVVDFQYKSKKHLFINIRYDGGEDYIEIIENKNNTVLKTVYSMD
jgi:uncharacterized protein (TIGR02145 family)